MCIRDRIQERDRVAIHPDVAEAVDAILRGQAIDTEVRWLDENGEVRVEKPLVELKKGKEKKTAGRDQHRIYLFGVNRGRLEHMAREMNLDLEIVDKVEEANLLVTSKNYYRRKPQKVRDAEAANLPIYVLKSNTPPQIRQMLQNIYPLAVPGKRDSFQVALAEAEEAVAKIKNGSEGEVELSPQSAYIRRLQHLIAERNEMASRSEGKDPNRRVKIYKA